MRYAIRLSLLIVGLLPLTSAAQSSSMLRMNPVRPETGGAGSPEEAGNMQYSANTGSTEFSAVQPRHRSRPGTQAIERMSKIAVAPVQPRQFTPNMLITIIVREQKKYEAEAEYEAEKKWKWDELLSRWFRFYPDCKLGEDHLSNGKPGSKFDLKHKYETDGSSDYSDKFSTRITAKIIDVKPNGNLVLEATHTRKHDEEVANITLTGVCRSEDVTPDNTIMSTQIAEMVLDVQNKGAVRDATTRGWIPRILDFIKPL